MLHRLSLSLILCLQLIPAIQAFEQTGIASWYGGIFQGRLTANGEMYDTYTFTAAHKTLPFGTILKVTNLENNKSVKVRVNDRGPFVDNRIIDLSYVAAKKLDMIRSGTANVIITADYDSIPTVSFNVQIGTWRNLEKAKEHKSRLEKAGLSPDATLSKNGTTRLTLKNIGESGIYQTVQHLKDLGYTDLMIYQISG